MSEEVKTMDTSKKAIIKRINEELREREWGQTDLLERIIKYQIPGITDEVLRAKVKSQKGNFSTALKPNSNRMLSLENLYFISKAFRVPLEYLWFGEDKKSGFVPSGKRYAAFQDTENEYRAYIASLGHEDYIQHPDELGFNLFQYFGQYDSINGYRFFANKYGLYFDYAQHGQLMYINNEKYPQFCCHSDDNNLLSDNLMMTLVSHNDVKTFKTIYFDNCLLDRFNPEGYHRPDKKLFGDTFLDLLLKNEPFLALTANVKTLSLDLFNKGYSKDDKRDFIEPMFYAALDYALEHENEYNKHLEKMLRFALEYNKNLYEFTRDFIEKNKNTEHDDAFIDKHSPTVLRSSRYVVLGNIFRIVDTSKNKTINNLIKEINKLVFNMTHIINEQEKNNEEIQISTPDNPLFIELHDNANKKGVDYIPTKTFSNKDYTHFRYYESVQIDQDNVEQVEFIMDCLNKAQELVKQKNGKALVHGNLHGRVLMTTNGKITGLAGWQQCHYGDKYEDRSELLFEVDYFYSYDDKFLTNYKKMFDVIAQGLTDQEQRVLIERTIKLLNKNMKTILDEKDGRVFDAFKLKERIAKLEFFKELYLK